MIPYLILKQQILELQAQIAKEEEDAKKRVLNDALMDVVPEVMKEIRQEMPSLTNELSEKILQRIIAKTCSGVEVDEAILNLSKEEYHKLVRDIGI